MRNFTNNSVPEIQTYGGNTVIMRTSTDLAKTRLTHWADKPRIVNMITNGNFDHVTNLGLINFAASRYSNSVTPMYKNWFEDRAIMYLDGDRMRFEIPVESEDAYLKTVADTSEEFGEAPGLNGQTLELVLNRELKAGRIITPDVSSGFQLIVSEDVPTRPELNGFRHTLQLVQNDKFKYFPTQYMKSDIEYFKGDGALGELSTEFMGWDMGAASNTLMCEFILGHKRGVEAGLTEEAEFRANSEFMKSLSSKFKEEFEAEKDRDQVFMFEAVNQDITKAIPSTIRLGNMQEILTLKELYRSEAWGLVWNQAGKVNSINGGFKWINEGLYHQFRRGYRFEYDLVDGITFDLLSEVNSLIFPSDFKMEDRRTHYEGGMNATLNTKSILQEAAIEKIPMVQALHNHEKLLPKGESLVGGSISEGLTIKRFEFSSIYVEELGMISVEHNPAFDHKYGMSRQERHRYGGGRPYTSHTLMMRDWTNSKYSNAFSQKFAGARVMEGGNEGANIYYVRPAENMYYSASGWSDGRYSSVAQNMSQNILSSLQTMSSSFWTWRRSASFMKDPTKVVIIELSRDTYDKIK